MSADHVQIFLDTHPLVRLGHVVRNAATEKGWHITTGRLNGGVMTARLMPFVARIKAAAPNRTLQQIGAQLEAMYERSSPAGTQ